MAEVSSSSPVAAAAEWLARQGIDVPAGPEHASPEPGRAVSRGERSGRAQARQGRSVGRRPVEPDEPKVAEPAGEPDADPYAVAHSIALRKLTAQDRTRHELARALQRREVPDEVADQVLDRLQEVGLVDDAAFAAGWVESRQQRRHLSSSALRRELQGKGVEREQIDAALDSVGYSDELAAARELARRRHATLVALPYPVRYRRLAGVLGRRGFGAGIVAQVLREVVGED